MSCFSLVLVLPKMLHDYSTATIPGCGNSCANCRERENGVLIYKNTSPNHRGNGQLLWASAFIQHCKREAGLEMHPGAPVHLLLRGDPSQTPSAWGRGAASLPSCCCQTPAASPSPTLGSLAAPGKAQHPHN